MEDERNNLKEMLEEEEESKKNVEKQLYTAQTQVCVPLSRWIMLALDQFVFE